jgi:IMP dehydrogenase
MIISEALTFDDIAMVPRYSRVPSRKDPSTMTVVGKDVLSIPIIASPMSTVTGPEMMEFMQSQGGSSVLHRYLSVEEQVSACRGIPDHSLVAVGVSGDYKERFRHLHNAGVRNFCVDVANGSSEVCVDAVRYLRKMSDNLQTGLNIMAGNVCEYVGAYRLAEAGADSIRVGIGPGSLCTTRLVTGHGIPQVTAIVETAKIKKHFPNVSIVADGGIRSSGDIVKALALGADAVMIGGLLAGTDKTPGKVKRSRWLFGKKYKSYKGMASVAARKEWFDHAATNFVPEGADTIVPYRGSAKEIVERLVGGLKVGMSFADARNLDELRANAKFVRITENGRVEGTPNFKMFKK